MVNKTVSSTDFDHIIILRHRFSGPAGNYLLLNVQQSPEMVGLFSALL